MDVKAIAELDKKYFMPVFGDRLPVAFERGEGAYLYDNTGKKYTDFLAGIAVNSLGYSDEGFTKAVTGQVEKLLHSSNYFYIEPQARLAEALCKKTGIDGKVFFANSGAEANECAIKLAKKYAYDKGGSSARFVSVANSFHGRTLATLTATGQDKFHLPFEPGTYDYTYIPANDIEAAKKVCNKGNLRCIS
jgi:acetylornithine aminotransferase/acetylornithine/N-succinyldiaminopimelate aminotransferase